MKERSLFYWKPICMLLLVALLFSSIAGTVAFADTPALAVADLDKSDVLADLKTSENFNLEEYKFKTGASPEILSFVEYCYSPIANYKSLYGLYVYMYNPGGYILETEGHEINIATTYVMGTDGEMRPSQYELFELQLIDVSDNTPESTDVTYNLFWKFKVVDKVSQYDGLTIQQRVNPTMRQYDVAGIQLTSISNENVFATMGVRDVKVGGTYCYSGYATGMTGTTTSEPLKCTQTPLDVVELDVKSTYYRTETHANGDGWQNDINAVYFSVPKSFFSKYGELKRIKAEWYEFVTQKILVTNNQDFYNTAKNFIGKTDFQKYTWAFNEDGFPDPTYNLPYCALADYKKQTTITGTIGHTGVWGWGFNGYVNGPPIGASEWEEKLWYLFLVENYSEYDPSKSIEEQGGISGERLEEYVNAFVETYPDVAGETITIGGNKIPKALFQDISENRKTQDAFGVIQSGFDGKSTYEFDVEIGGKLGYETFDWSTGSFSEKVSMLDGEKWRNWKVFWGNIPEQEMERNDIEYITTIEPEHATNYTNEMFCKEYLVNAYDASAIKSYVVSEHQKGNVVILFRYAVTDYFAQELSLMERESTKSQKFKDAVHHQGYVAQATAFLNFDIIQLTFKDTDGNYTALGVVADPINIYPDITPEVKVESPSNDAMWTRIVQLFLSVIGFILIAVIVVATFKYAFGNKDDRRGG